MIRSGLSRYFGFRERVDRRLYSAAGVSLMLLKYGVDSIVIWLVARQVWTPWDYLLPLVSLRGDKAAALPAWLSAALIVWTLPFLWLGVSMTLRRAVDAGRSPWWCLLFFVPVINYLLMLWLAALPRAPDVPWNSAPVPVIVTRRLQSAVLGILASVGIGVAAVFLSAFVLRTYGLALFLATPFVLGLVSAFLHNRGHARTPSETAKVILLSLLMVGGTLILFALEGLLCVAMAFPLCILIALLGGAVGRAIAIRASAARPSAACCLLLLPAMALVDHTQTGFQISEVVTTIEVSAPPESVWEQVIQFKDITDRPTLPFRLGIAYPVRAHINGSGKGAVRLCDFSTGAFIEPITVWDAPRRLAFDVADQPPVLQEWSPYRKVYAPHVQSAFRAYRGEFRLLPLQAGRTRLEGRTWYRLGMRPQMYWQPITAWLLRQIHTRVLEQVKREAESASGRASATDAPEFTRREIALAR